MISACLIDELLLQRQQPQGAKFSGAHQQHIQLPTGMLHECRAIDEPCQAAKS
jgi:hypothetical protein